MKQQRKEQATMETPFKKRGGGERGNLNTIGKGGLSEMGGGARVRLASLSKKKERFALRGKE